MDKKNIILVTGATGQQGGAVAKELLAHGYKVRAMTRKPEGDTARALAKQGAEIIKGDLDDDASLKQAVKGAWGVFAVQNTWEAGVEGEERQGKRLAKIAREGGIQHYIYTSVGSAQRATGIPHFDNKYRVEESIRELNFPSFTIMRPVFFMDNWTSPWFKPAIDQGNVALALKPETALQMIAVKDIGKYGFWAFENHEKLNGQAFDIAGDSLTMPGVASVIGSVMKKPIGFIRVPIEEVRKINAEFAIMLEWFDRVGYNADIPGMARQSGIAPTTFAGWAAGAKW
jgi:uncharacterized protein YbjT (DUF2867 family)